MDLLTSLTCPVFCPVGDVLPNVSGAAATLLQNVSALSQVVSCSFWNPASAASQTSQHTTSTEGPGTSVPPAAEEVTEEVLLARAAGSAAAAAGRLRVFAALRLDCRAAQLHPLFDAAWRRYLYLMPLPLPLSPQRRRSCLPSAGDGPRQQDEETRAEPVRGAGLGLEVDVAFLAAALQRLEGRRLCYKRFAHLPARGRNGFTGGRDRGGRNSNCKRKRTDAESEHEWECSLLRARAFPVALPARERGRIIGRGSTGAICVELVGDRFLRRMVRILVVSSSVACCTVPLIRVGVAVVSFW